MNQTRPHNNLSPEDVMRVWITGVRAMYAGHNPDKKLKELRKHLGNAAKQLGIEPTVVRQMFDKIKNEKEKEGIKKMKEYFDVYCKSCIEKISEEEKNVFNFSSSNLISTHFCPEEDKIEKLRILLEGKNIPYCVFNRQTEKCLHEGFDYRARTYQYAGYTIQGTIEYPGFKEKWEIKGEKGSYKWHFEAELAARELRWLKILETMKPLATPNRIYGDLNIPLTLEGLTSGLKDFEDVALKDMNYTQMVKWVKNYKDSYPKFAVELWFRKEIFKNKIPINIEAGGEFTAFVTNKGCFVEVDITPIMEDWQHRNKFGLLPISTSYGGKKYVVVESDNDIEKLKKGLEMGDRQGDLYPL
jgi:hypothetical protein